MPGWAARQGALARSVVAGKPDGSIDTVDFGYLAKNAPQPFAVG